MKPVKYKRLLNRNCDTICVQKKNIHNKKRREKNENKEPGYLLHPKWAFYPQLCIYWFLVLRGYKVQRCTFLRVRESILKRRLPCGSSDRLKLSTEFFCLGRGVKCGLARPPRGLLEKHADALSPVHAQCQEEKKHGLRERRPARTASNAQHRVRPLQTRRPVDQFPVPHVPSCLSNSWPGISR